MSSQNSLTSTPVKFNSKLEEAFIEFFSVTKHLQASKLKRSILVGDGSMAENSDLFFSLFQAYSTKTPTIPKLRRLFLALDSTFVNQIYCCPQGSPEQVGCANNDAFAMNNLWRNFRRRSTKNKDGGDLVELKKLLVIVRKPKEGEDKADNKSSRIPLYPGVSTESFGSEKESDEEEEMEVESESDSEGVELVAASRDLLEDYESQVEDDADCDNDELQIDEPKSPTALDLLDDLDNVRDDEVLPDSEAEETEDDVPASQADIVEDLDSECDCEPKQKSPKLMTIKSKAMARPPSKQKDAKAEKTFGVNEDDLLGKDLTTVVEKHAGLEEISIVNPRGKAPRGRPKGKGRGKGRGKAKAKAGPAPRPKCLSLLSPIRRLNKKAKKATPETEDGTTPSKKDASEEISTTVKTKKSKAPTPPEQASSKPAEEVAPKTDKKKTPEQALSKPSEEVAPKTDKKKTPGQASSKPAKKAKQNVSDPPEQASSEPAGEVAPTKEKKKKPTEEGAPTKEKKTKKTSKPSEEDATEEKPNYSDMSKQELADLMPAFVKPTDKESSRNSYNRASDSDSKIEINFNKKSYWITRFIGGAAENTNIDADGNRRKRNYSWLQVGPSAAWEKACEGAGGKWG